MRPNSLKVINTTCKGNLVALQLRLRGGRITPAMRRCFGGHEEVLRVVESPKPDKIFVLTDVSVYAEKGPRRTAFVEYLNQIARAAA